MKTATKLGKADHGRSLTLEEFLGSEYEPGFHYEIIEGRLYVSPQPDVPLDILERWLSRHLSAYALANPHVINYVTPKARVFVPGATEPTAPEPDLGAYRDFPLDQDWLALDWARLHPVLLCEIISAGDPSKDTDRNVRLYRQVRSIQEYWILDPRPQPDRPSLTIHRRARRRWDVLEVAFGETYTTPLLPGFSLVVDPRRT